MHTAINPKVAELDLSYVEARLLSEGLGTEQAADTIDQYRKLLTIAIENPGRRVAPSLAMDRAIHAHVSHTALYRRHCALLTDGGFVDHDPTIVIGMPELEEAWEFTREQMRSRFGLELPAIGAATGAVADAANCALVAGAANCALVAQAANCALVAQAANCALVAAEGSSPTQAA